MSDTTPLEAADALEDFAADADLPALRAHRCTPAPPRQDGQCRAERFDTRCIRHNGHEGDHQDKVGWRWAGPAPGTVPDPERAT